MDLLRAVAPGSGALLSVMNGKKDPAAPTLTPADEYDGFQDGCDFEVGDYRVTGAGTLMKKTRGKRKRAVVEGAEEDVGGALAHAVGSGDTSEFRHGSGRQPTDSFEVDEEALIIPGALRHVGTNFKNTLIVMPPMELWGPIQKLRKEHDPAYDRWMPHINMVWPFFDASGHEQAALLLKRHLKNFKPFRVHFNGFNTFKKGVMYLEPTTEAGARLDSLYSLHEEMRKCFPETTADQEFTPHLTVAKGDAKKVKKMAEEEPWEAMSFDVTEVYMATREGHTDPFWITEIIPLGGKGGS